MKKKPTAYEIIVQPRKDCPYYTESFPIDIEGDRPSDYLEYQWINDWDAESTRRKAWAAYKKKHCARYMQAKIEKIY